MNMPDTLNTDDTKSTPPVEEYTYKGWLVSNSFWKRSFAVFGYYMVAHLLLTLVFGIVFIVIVGLGGLF